jgi:hypothetical protein
MSSSSGGSEESLVASQSQPRASRASYEPDEEDDSDNSFLPPFRRRAHAHHKESSEGTAVLEALPLLRRPSIYLDRAKSNLSLGAGRGPSYGSDAGSLDGDEDGERLVRVQSGVKKVEAITMLWTRKSLVVAYVRYGSVAQFPTYRQYFSDCHDHVARQQYHTSPRAICHFILQYPFSP